MRENFNNKTKYHFREFDHWYEFVDFAEGADDCPLANDPEFGRSSLEDPDGHWAGKLSWKECLKTARLGMPELYDMVEPLRKEIIDKLGNKIVRQEVDYDVTGAYVDVDRYLMGEPECMATFYEKVAISRFGTIVRLVVPIAASSGISPDQIKRRGGALMALVDGLEVAGHSCEIIVSEKISGSCRSDIIKGREVVIPVKRVGELMDISLLCYVLMHPSVLRRLIFAEQERMISDYRKGLGTGRHNYTGYGQPEHDSILKSDVPIAGAGEISSAKEAYDWVYKMLDRFEVFNNRVSV